MTLVIGGESGGRSAKPLQIGWIRTDNSHRKTVQPCAILRDSADIL
jgi:hypothetical protein